MVDTHRYLMSLLYLVLPSVCVCPIVGLAVCERISPRVNRVMRPYNSLV